MPQGAEVREQSSQVGHPGPSSARGVDRDDVVRPVAEGRAHQTGQHVARTDFREGPDSRGVQMLELVDEVHGGHQLTGQRVADGRGVRGVGFRRAVRVHR